jgi:patatin-like phospholipase/acyl hydrolase
MQKMRQIWFSSDHTPDFSVAKAVRCSSAAPTFLPAKKIEKSSNSEIEGTFVDGGITLNNPS